jgi:hypothetical protein
MRAVAVPVGSLWTLAFGQHEPTATSRRAKLLWLRSAKAGGGNSGRDEWQSSGTSQASSAMSYGLFLPDVPRNA